MKISRYIDFIEYFGLVNLDLLGKMHFQISEHQN